MRFFQFTKADRILKRSDFLRISKYGIKLHNKCFVIIFCKGRLKKTRLGVTVSKRVGNAVERNRIKRILREYFRLNIHTVAGCWDINIIAKKEVSNLTSSQMFFFLQKIFDNTSLTFAHD